MAEAIVRDGITNIRTLKLAHTVAVDAGDVIVSNGQVLVAVSKKDADAANAYVFRGKVEFPKAASLAIAPGDACYWDVADGNINKTATDNTKAGICVEAAAEAESTVLVMLGENK